MMLANRMRAAAAGRKTLEFFDEATSTGASITIPAGAPAGAIAILAQLAINNGTTSAPSLVTPSGWTNITGLGDTASFDTFPNSGDRGIRVAVCARVLDADDEGDSITGMDGSGEDRKRMLVFTPNFTPSAIVANDEASDARWNGNPPSQALSSDLGTVPLIAIGIGVTMDAVPLGPTTNDFDNDVFDTISLGMSYSIYNEGDTPADHNFDVGNPNGFAVWLATAYFEIS